MPKTAVLVLVLVLVTAAQDARADRSNIRPRPLPRYVSPAERAKMAAAKQAEASANQPVDVAFFKYTLKGRSLEEIRQMAKEKAMATTIGGFYFDDRFIVAPEVLDTYLAPRLDTFVSGVKVLEVRQGVGTIDADLQVAINRYRLEADLTEKRFFYEPRRKPHLHIALAERLDGQQPLRDYARQEALATLTNLGGRPAPHPVEVPATSLDVDANQDLLYQALVACRRQGIEVLVTGTVECRREKQQRLYYTSYSFFLTDITLKLIEVQNGRTLRTVTLTAKGNDPDPSFAAKLSMERAARDAMTQLLDGFFDEWRNRTQGKSDYRIMIGDIGSEDLGTFRTRLEAIEKGTRVFEKSYVNGVAVLNLFYTGDAGRLRQYLLEMPYPKFNVDLFEGKRIKLSILP